MTIGRAQRRSQNFALLLRRFLVKEEELGESLFFVGERALEFGDAVFPRLERLDVLFERFEALDARVALRDDVVEALDLPVFLGDERFALGHRLAAAFEFARELCHVVEGGLELFFLHAVGFPQFRESVGICDGRAGGRHVAARWRRPFISAGVLGVGMGRSWENALLVIWVGFAFVSVSLAIGLAAAGGWILAAFTAAVALVPFALWRDVRRRRLGIVTLPERKPRNPVAVPTPDALAELDVINKFDGPFSACPRCAFLGVRMAGLGDGLWPGGGETGGRFVCPRCDWQGLPVEFDDADAYGKFVEALRAEARES